LEDHFHERHYQCQSELYETYWQRVKLAFDERKIVDPYFNKTVMIRGDKVMGTHWGIM
jgi:hypothetical protein